MNFSSIDTLWVLFAAALVFFMQAGFAMVETGFTRAKNAGNIIMKNMIDLSIGTVAFWVVGFGFMFGTANGFIGGFDFFALDYLSGDQNVGIYHPMAFLIFQTVFCATSATIVSGAMAERTKFSAYLIYSLFISLIVYPVSGHWIWGGGWLSTLGVGFHDFAGSTVVHMVGGISALIGAKFLGPRIGKYEKTKDGKYGKPRAIPGHSVTLGALGVFILWFGWFGFNGGSTTALSSDGAMFFASNAFVTTNMAAATGSLATLFLTWIKYKKPDVSMTLNGALAGLVAVTAGADVLDPWAAALVGLVAGILIVYGIEFIDKKLKIDDPVGAIGVHCFCGAFGTICVGLFSRETGLLYGFGFEQLGIQLLGIVSVGAWVGVTISILFIVLKKTTGIRVSPEHELVGLDISEHGLARSYADFMPMPDFGTSVREGITLDEAEKKYEESLAPKPEGVVVVDKSTKNAKMTKVVILTAHNRFEPLKAAMDKLGITGMTVTNVMGCGIQRGGREFYRGVAIESTLLPKIKVEIVVSKIPPEKVVEAAKAALCTGKIGDGKIFVYDVENVVRIRTGEEGYDALQDE
jgi:Amt family ammonium transporter